MRYFNCFFWIVFFSSISVFSQEKYKQHIVAKGETINEIAQKYNVPAADIYELNPDAVNGIKLKTILLIPSKAKKTTTVAKSASTNALPEKTHVILPKETVYGIAKQHQVAVEDLYKSNPNLEKEGLKIEQIIKIPGSVKTLGPNKGAGKEMASKKANVSDEKVSNEKNVVPSKLDDKKEFQTKGFQYVVLPNESLYSIAKKQGVSLSDLQKANPELGKKSLQVGQKINLPLKADGNLVANENAVLSATYKTSSLVADKSVLDTKSKSVEKTTIINSKTDIELSATKTHEVLPKESLYSISKKYGFRVDELQKANPDLGAKSLKVGQKINIPIIENNNLSLVETKNGVTKDKSIQNEYTHVVLVKETKYGIAKQYGLTVAELEKQNPSISNSLLVGAVLKIRIPQVVQKLRPSELAATDSKVTEVTASANLNPIMEHDAAFVEQLISKASENLGTRYRSGGTTAEGFDCSGLIYYTFANTDVKLPRSSVEMANHGSIIEAENTQKGDLIFFKTRGSGRINHVGMVVEVLYGEIKFIHSATHGGVMISSTKESYYEKNFVQVNRVLSIK